MAPLAVAKPVIVDEQPLVVAVTICVLCKVTGKTWSLYSRWPEAVPSCIFAENPNVALPPDTAIHPPPVVLVAVEGPPPTH